MYVSNQTTECCLIVADLVFNGTGEMFYGVGSEPYITPLSFTFARLKNRKHIKCTIGFSSAQSPPCAFFITFETYTVKLYDFISDPDTNHKLTKWYRFTNSEFNFYIVFNLNSSFVCFADLFCRRWYILSVHMDSRHLNKCIY